MDSSLLPSVYPDQNPANVVSQIQFRDPNASISESITAKGILHITAAENLRIGKGVTLKADTIVIITTGTLQNNGRIQAINGLIIQYAELVMDTYGAIPAPSKFEHYIIRPL